MKSLLQTHNFILGPCDTDSISFCKPDMSEFTEKEQNDLLEEINSYMPELIRFSHDGYYKSCVALKAKNYVLKDFSGKVKLKGSALKPPNREPALKEVMEQSLTILSDYSKEESCVKIKVLYNQYVKEAMAVQDISRWSFKKSITERVLNSERANETKVLDALEGEEFQEGDKRFFYYKEDGTLGLREQFDGNYDKKRLLEKLFKTTQIFSTVIPKDTFLNYKLKRNEQALAILLQS
jgi:DNA polymerase elongation subunit (family B)